MIRRLLGCTMALVVYSAANAAPSPVVLPPPVVVPTLTTGVTPQPISLSRVLVKLNDGQVWARHGALWGCNLMSREVRWKAEQSELDNERFKAVFEEEARRAGFMGSASESLFDTGSSTGSLQIGVIIRDMQAQICSAAETQYSPAVFRGHLAMTAEWQIYDPLKREIVARVETSAGGEEKQATTDGVERVVYAAFRQSVRALLADERFRQAALTPKGASASAGAAGSSLTPISLASVPAVKRSIPDASGSVVAIFTGEGHGSGFLVSDDGYLITNQHVVGGAKYVMIRWSDGFETVGEVIRSDRRRDVALVKTDPHGRSALALRRGGLQPGEAVFALGTPLDPKFQGTVTKGVVSSTRILDGFSYIQSDVTVNPGNSGGPLLDEKGAVVGITVLGFQPDGVPTGINLFIPIGDALDFLNLKPSA